MRTAILVVVLSATTAVALAEHAWDFPPVTDTRDAGRFGYHTPLELERVDDFALQKTREADLRVTPATEFLADGACANADAVEDTCRDLELRGDTFFQLDDLQQLREQQSKEASRVGYVFGGVTIAR